MLKQLEFLKQKYLSLQKKISENKENLKNVSLLKDFGELEKIVLIYNDYLQLTEEKKKINQILESNEEKEFILLAQQEKNILEQKIQDLLYELQLLLLPEENNDNKNVVMEIKAAAGGNESNLFVADLFRAYMKYAEKKNWKTEIIHLNSTSGHGIMSVEIIFSGKNIYSLLKYESGVHRVQRVPATEKRGRIHTSTVKILVTPTTEKIKLSLNWDEIRVDTFNSSGPGGQSVNTTKSAVRLTHLPTGVYVSSQTAKSQHQNKEIAFQLLQKRINHQISVEKQKEQNNNRKNLIGSGERSIKIRTYNYTQNRITDHRINLTLKKLDFFMEGEIELILIPLIDKFNNQKLKEIFQN